MLKRFGLIGGGQIVAAVTPVDLAAGAVAGPWASMRNCDELYVIVIKSAGTAGDDPVFTLAQATDASGTGAKALNITKLDYQLAADITAETEFEVANASDGNPIERHNSVASYEDETSAELEMLAVFRVQQDDLDADNNFCFVRGEIADAGAAAQLGAMLYIATGLNYAGHNKPAFNE